MPGNRYLDVRVFRCPDAGEEVQSRTSSLAFLARSVSARGSLRKRFAHSFASGMLYLNLYKTILYSFSGYNTPPPLKKKNGVSEFFLLGKSISIYFED